MHAMDGWQRRQEWNGWRDAGVCVVGGFVQFFLFRSIFVLWLYFQQSCETGATIIHLAALPYSFGC